MYKILYELTVHIPADNNIYRT